MFKLIAVGGKIRGKEFVLNEGENIFGRSLECDFPLKIDGVSKKHLSLTVNGESCFLEDLKSSNGTFVNGKIIKKQTVVDKDKITLPNVIFQLVYVKEKKKIVKKKSKQVTAYQKALNKKLKQDFPGIKVKNLGDGMSEISFG